MIGNGKQVGRGGFCTDSVSEDVSGPRLVIIPTDSGRFAITKYEVSWAQFGVFCQESAICGEAPSDGATPVTGVPYDAAMAYAEWLSDVFDSLALEQVVMLGISLGGWMSLKFATS